MDRALFSRSPAPSCSTSLSTASCMSSPAFSIASENPNPSPYPNQNFYFQSLPQNLNPDHPSSSSSQALPDLTTTLASLPSLLSLCHQTLTSHYSISNPQNAYLVPCPFNPQHLMPPEALFPHSLRCPFPLHIDPPNYRNTLKDSSELLRQGTNFDQGSNADLCLSLDDYLADVGSGFFYKDCPGVVNLSHVDNLRKTFVLPKVLSVECADFMETSGRSETEIYEKDGFRVLPSNLWTSRREVEGWADYPNAYSFNVLCVIVGLRTVKGNDLKRWLIANSPHYGIVIDQYMRDHICVLFDLSLKAIVKEAVCLWKTPLAMFKCPILVQALMWLGFQLAVLYGEVTGKLFALNMFKQWILENALHLSLFPLDKRAIEFRKIGGLDGLSYNSGVVLEGESEESYETNKPEKEVGENVSGRMIFVSQVAAAVAALHERVFLEEKIRQSRASLAVGRYQRLAEHNYISGRSDEERKRHTNYRPIIEHDGLPRQSLTNQETGKPKTREELLAEERDYKRRRMSYRGKKSKRTPLQVMRDIIEEYTEEIKTAGGIGCFVKGTEEGTLSQSETPLTCRPVVEVADYGRNVDDVSLLDSGGPDYHRSYGYGSRGTSFGSVLQKDYDRSRLSKSEDHVYPEDLQRSDAREKHSEEYHRGRSKRHKSHGSEDRSCSHRRAQDKVKSTRSRNYEVRRESSSLSINHDHRSSCSMSKSTSRSYEKDDQILELKEMNGSSLRNYSNVSQGENGFEDRYDLSESHDM